MPPTQRGGLSEDDDERDPVGNGGLHLARDYFTPPGVASRGILEPAPSEEERRVQEAQGLAGSVVTTVSAMQAIHASTWGPVLSRTAELTGEIQDEGLKNALRILALSRAMTAAAETDQARVILLHFLRKQAKDHGVEVPEQLVSDGFQEGLKRLQVIVTGRMSPPQPV